MTKKQLTAIITAMEDNARACAKLVEESGNEELAKCYRYQASAFASAVLCIENAKHAKEVAEIYGIEI